MGKLVLSRRCRESVLVTIEGRAVTVTVESVGSDKVRLSFDAEKCVKIDRKEVADKKRGAA